MLNDALGNVKHLQSLYNRFCNECKIVPKDSDDIQRNRCFVNVCSAIKKISNLIITKQNQEALMQAAYFVAKNKIYFEESSIFINDNVIISAYNLTQHYGEKGVFDNFEKDNGVSRIADLANLALKITSNPSLVAKNKIQTKSKNAQKFLCNIIHDAVEYCCNIVNHEVVRPFTNKNKFCEILISTNDIQDLYSDIYNKYELSTHNGRSLICRAFLKASEDWSDVKKTSCLSRLNVLNNCVLEYIYRKIIEVTNILSQKYQIDVSASQYTYSYNLSNQFKMIRDCLFDSNDKMK